MAPPSNPYPALPAAVSGDRVEFPSRSGPLSVYQAGEGPPLLLVHSVNAAASAAEMRPLHEHYRAQRTVFTIDLPGYGFSDRSDRNYTPRLMTNALLDTVEWIRQRCGPAPLDALALSLSCEFLARAAVESPGLFRSLALVSPTGLSGQRAWRAPAGTTRGVPWLYRALRGPAALWGDPLFRALTRPAVIRYFLRRTWGGRDIDDALWRYDVITTRQPGAELAPLCFLAAWMFSADIHTVYEKLSLPVWLSHGVRGDFTDYRQKQLVESRPNWRFHVFQTGAMPYFEVPEAFIQAYDAFLADPSATGPVTP